MTVTKADFSGWATKAGLKCSDGRTITPNAFLHQDKITVPLVWQHGHKDPTNVLGHAVLENRGEEGVYTYAFFNDTPAAQHAKAAVAHGDVTQLSIWANQLVQKGKQVLHGMIREVSLVLSGANPGALIDNVQIEHSDGDITEVDDEAIIYTGLELSHDDLEVEVDEDADVDDVDVDDDNEDADGESDSADGDEDDGEDNELDAEHAQQVYDSFDDDQRELLHTLVDFALSGEDVLHEGMSEDTTVGDVIKTMTTAQKNVLYYMVGQAIDLDIDNVEHDSLDSDDQEGNDTMTHKNVFEQNNDQQEGTVLTHDNMREIARMAESTGSWRRAAEQYAEAHLEHGITDIDTLFPDAQMVDNMPQLLQRRTEWVGVFLGGATKRPFARIKTLYADLTEDEARARGYITGNMKKEEFFPVAKRETTATTIYKKQKLDRDDLIDITDFDVIGWLKGEMRLMLDEEIARACLLGDGRDVASTDKISETNIRPIATDHELFTVTVNVNIRDASSSVQEVIDAVVRNRKYYKGSGSPVLFCGEDLVADFLLLKDGFNRPMYSSLDEVARVLRVRSIVPCELIDEDPDLIGVIVNPADYSIGTDRGGQVSMFDDFDIDYNQEKYLIETRMSGAMTRLKGAQVLVSVAAASVEVTPAAPAFDAVAGEITITDQTGVIYRDKSDDSAMNAAGSPYSVASGESFTVYAEPDTNYHFPSSEADEWTFTAE